MRATQYAVLTAATLLIAAAGCRGGDRTASGLDGWLAGSTAEKFDVVARWTPTDPIGGRPLLRMPAWSAPILSHGLLYVRGADRVLCVELIPQ